MYTASSVKNRVKKEFFASENKMADEKQRGSKQYLLLFTRQRYFDSC